MSMHSRAKADGGSFNLDDVEERREELITQLAEDGTLSETDMRELHRNLVMESSIRAFKHSELTQDDIADDLEKYARVVRNLDG